MQYLNIAPLADFAAVALGSLFALLLWTARRGNHVANRWLAGCVGALALLSAGDLLEDTRWNLVYPQLAHTTDWLIFVVGPCAWLYVRRLTLVATPRAWRAALHFAPAGLCLLLLLPFYLLPLEQKRLLLAAELADDTRLNDPMLAVAAAHILVYWIAALLSLRKFARRLKDQYSSIEKRSFRWLAWVLTVTLFIWLFWLLGLTLRTPDVAWLNLLAVPLGLYVLALAGLRQPAVFLLAEPSTTLDPTTVTDTAVALPPEATLRYARSGLDKKRATAMRAHLEQLMELEKPWLENDLTLPQLAERAGISPHHLSQLLNEEIGQSFFDFINSRRVAEVQRCLADPAYVSQSLLEIALAAGFNSKTAFNTAFKKHAGLTPSQFRARSSPEKPADA